MKKIIIIPLLFLTLISKSQKIQYNFNDLKDSITSDLCDCLVKNNYKNYRNFDIYGKCLMKSIFSHKSLITQTIFNIYGDTTSAIGEAAGKIFYNSIGENMVLKCDLYYNEIVNSRYLLLNKIKISNKDSIQIELSKSNLINKSNRGYEFYFDRASNYFHLLDFTSCRKELTLLEKLGDKPEFLSYHLRAEMAEYEENYNEAIKYYTLINGKFGMNFQPIISMLKRKNSELK